MSSGSTNIKDKLKNVKNKLYQIVNKNGKIEKQFVASGKGSSHVVTLRFQMLGFTIFCMQYIVKESEIESDDYLKMIGLHFIKDNITKYSLDIVNKKDTNDAELYLYSFNDSGALVDTELVEKIDKFPENNKVIQYLLNKLSHDKLKKIF